MVVDVSEGATFHVPKEDNDYFQIIHIMDENHLLHKVVRRGETLSKALQKLSVIPPLLGSLFKLGRHLCELRV